MRERIVRLGIVLGIILAVTPLKAAVAGGGGACHEGPITQSGTAGVVMNNACFTPTIARVPVGSTVTWFNKDHFNHTMTGANLTFGSLEEKGVDAVWKVTFDRAGVYPYYCFIHPGMVGSIVVGSDAQLVSQLGKGVLEIPDNVVDAALKTPVGSKAKDATSAWPAAAAGIGIGSVGIGFGFGRRAGRNGHTTPSDA